MLRVEPKRDLVSVVRAKLALRVLNVLVRAVHGRFRFKGVEVVVPKGCFAPTFVSTSLLYDTALDAVKGCKLGCEIGTGVGSLALALVGSLGVEIVGTDVDLRCLREAGLNARRNSLDPLFHAVACVNAQALRGDSFDFVVINPPYLPLPPEGPAGTAACGGSQLELLNAMLQDGVRVARKGGLIVFTTSSLTTVSGAKLVGERWAVLDSVRSYLYVK
ncbi:MAG: methyltransferase [Thermofilaceae archaeon]